MQGRRLVMRLAFLHDAAADGDAGLLQALHQAANDAAVATAVAADGGRQGNEFGLVLRAFRLRHGGRRAFAVQIKTPARFAAEETGVDHFLLQHGRREARIVEIGAEHGLRDGEIHVVADQVHQLEWAHAETARFAQHGIDGGRVARLLVQQAPAFRIERTGDAVDDEAGRRFRMHGVLAPGDRGVVDGGGDLLAGGQATDHFDQRHQRHGIKEVHADQAFRAAQLGGDGRHGNRRRVRRQDAVVADQRFEFGEQAALDVEIFHDGFHHQGAIAHVGQAAGCLQARRGGRRFVRRHAALFSQLRIHLADVGQRLAHGVRARVVQFDCVAGGRGHLRDAGAHGAAADDGDDTVVCQCAHISVP